MTTLKFRIYKKEFVEISSNDNDKRINSFFIDTFNKTFDRNKTLINLSEFLKNRTNVNQFLTYENILFEGSKDFIERMKESQ